MLESIQANVQDLLGNSSKDKTVRLIIIKSKIIAFLQLYCDKILLLSRKVLDYRFGLILLCYDTTRVSISGELKLKFVLPDPYINLGFNSSNRSLRS